MSTGFQLAGLALIVTGIALLSIPAAVISTGIVTLLIGLSLVK